MRSIFVFGALSIAIVGCSQTNAPATQASMQNPQPNIENIKGHMSFLADDLLEGRDTGSAGHEIASLYIASEFKKYGLMPAGDDGTYMQRVGFRKTVLVQDSPEFTVYSDDGEYSFDYPKDFIMGPDPVRTESQVSAELVFVGYGIIAPEFAHNDYEGLNVEGKIVVALSGKPSSLDSEEGAHLASGAQKSKYAVDNGAIGFITVQTPASEKVRSYQQSLNYIHAPRMRWVDPDGNVGNTNPELIVGAYLSMETAKTLFAHAPTPLEDIFLQLENNDIPTGFDIPVTVKLARESVHEDLSSPNVAAVLEGSDPVLKNEYVVFTAHSDHIGISKSVEKDRINNGALDNASGTSVMLETARMFASLPKAPARSVIFLAVTGEEKGLLGADYFAKNPTVPLASMVANVNLDMPLLTYEFADVIAFGASHSTMGKYVKTAAANADLKLTDDPWPQLNLFTRSDHYAFVKQGVPAIFLVTGIESKDPEVDGSEVLNTFLGTHYHRPSDDMNQDFDWRAARAFTQVNFEIGKTLADAPTRPTWYRDSFFGKTFGKEYNLSDRD
ncbi:M28 family metallopeptidase [Glaciecola siphonariae]|uniref:M28 family metallopeptidase n=1 Tax=Glaciecola siphonariae TaxID=521012 RepID=A0ABV9LZ55_9ALTE